MFVLSEGRLIGNAPDDSAARWRLMAVRPGAAHPPLPHAAGDQPHSNMWTNSHTMQSRLHGAGQSVPDVYDSPEAQLRWLSTDQGMDYLARTPELMQMFFDETLRLSMHRPDWPQAALRWRDYRQKETRDSPCCAPTALAASTDLLEGMHLRGPGIVPTGRFDTPDEFVRFKNNGYTVLSAAVPPEVLRRAKRITAAAALDPFSPLGEQRTVERDWSCGGGTCVAVKGPLLYDADVMALYYDSGVHVAVQKLVSGLPNTRG